MALHNVSETDDFPANVQMPSDGDPADASDFEASTIKPLTDRTRWLKNLIDILKDGGDWVLPGDSDTPLLAWKGVFKFDNTGLGDVAGIEFGGSSGGFVFGPITFANGSGRVPRKVVTGAPGTNQTVNPRFTDLVRYTPSAAIELQITADANYVQGDHFRVVNVSATGGRTITVKNPGGSTIFVVPVASGTRTSWADIVYDGTNWVECGTMDANA